MLEEGRSPAAALADIALEGLEFKTTICTSTFYGYITKGVFLMLTNKDLPEKAKRKRKYRKVKTAKRAPRGKSIEKRPAEVEGREVFGHWEMDTVYSGKQTSKKALLVLTERKTRQEIIERMPVRIWGLVEIVHKNPPTEIKSVSRLRSGCNPDAKGIRSGNREGPRRAHGDS